MGPGPDQPLTDAQTQSGLCRASGGHWGPHTSEVRLDFGFGGKDFGSLDWPPTTFFSEEIEGPAGQETPGGWKEDCPTWGLSFPVRLDWRPQIPPSQAWGGEPAAHPVLGTHGDALVAEYPSCVLALAWVRGQQGCPPGALGGPVSFSFPRRANGTHVSGDKPLAPSSPPIGGSRFLRVLLTTWLFSVHRPVCFLGTKVQSF